MKIEEGKYYRTRDGRKVGPVEWSKYGKQFATAPGFAGDQWYTQWNVHSGFTGRSSINGEFQDDLIDEWTDVPAAPKRLMQNWEKYLSGYNQNSKPPCKNTSPFVTRRELVPGVYGAFSVGPIDSMNRLHVMQGEAKMLTADELDEAAHLFAQLAEYLRETK